MNSEVRLKRLREEVYEANMEIVRRGLVVHTFGNASGIDRESGVVIIKPSGVDYNDLSPENMVGVDFEYNVVEGDLNPSSDTKTHVMLYRAFEEIGGIVHTHSKYATAWAQAKLPLLCLGTTHADYFYGEVPCTEVIRDSQIARDYEEETAVQIIETFRHYDYRSITAVLVASHGPFTWGRTPAEAVSNGFILEHVAELALLSKTINPEVKGIKQALLDKHFLRKHGSGAYYGQRKNPRKDEP
jgi:L-ribulose-5-phosphate 4-epimerase